MIVLNPTEELEIYLTQQGLKPSCLLGRCLTKKGILREDRKYFPEEYRKMLTNTKKPFAERINLYHGEQMANFYLGRNRKCLGRLLDAKTDQELGLALGYPMDAIESFFKVIEGELRDGTYHTSQLMNAVKKNIPIPNWIYYLSYIPADLDIVNGRISESAKMQGEFYESYVRKNNINLAEKLKDLAEKELIKLKKIHAIKE